MTRRLSFAAMTAAFVLTFAIVLGGCAPRIAGGARGGLFCETAKPIRMTPEAVDALTDEQARSALAHNKFGAEACGWKAVR